jgi:hypothetical protein
MKNITDSLDELRGMLDRLDKKMDSIIKQNEPPEDVEEEIEGDDAKAKEIWK